MKQPVIIIVRTASTLPVTTYYLKRTENGSWSLVDNGGIPNSLSNISREGTLLGIALRESETAEEALAYVKKYAYRQYADGARLMSKADL